MKGFLKIKVNNQIQNIFFEADGMQLTSEYIEFYNTTFTETIGNKSITKYFISGKKFKQHSFSLENVIELKGY
ncbi:hypothetical protein HBE96_23180 [Clostridium sp. P21]|uniref:Uncharacterized protein n=1 Tax=Clostridium muellerianum TaxID=2716538 RepID=A0A7Y0EN95_9CLOT|nr:hypothetical protein [Clostridium muellerianum]NMM65485.1 hypothetical protein [Clostridium muellerianum]